MAHSVSSLVSGQRERAIGRAADALMMPLAPVSSRLPGVTRAQAPRGLFILMPRLFINRMRRRDLHLVARIWLFVPGKRWFVPAGKRRFVPV
jgi:hypothetical protein